MKTATPRLRSAVLALLLAFALAGCPPAAPSPPPVVAIPTVPTPSSRAAEPAPPPLPPPPAPILPEAPAGYVEVTVLEATVNGFAAKVLLGVPNGDTAVEMMIGGTEGQSIALRFERRPFTRPLTDDLFDAALHELHAEILQAQIDSLREGVYYGTLVLVADGRVIPLDARPSDAVALALGARAPIYMAKTVLDRYGISRPPPSP